MRFGTYEVVEQVGVGATGTVFRARETGSGRLVALKQLSPQLSSTPAVMDRLRTEAAVLSSLDDPHVVALVGTGLDDDPPWIAVQWVQGATLDRVLQTHGRLSSEQAVGVLRGAVQGLAHAHSRGVVHRDVAPGNVLLDTAGTSMLIDFGLAVPIGTGGVCGTPAFLSPEAATGNAVGPTGDVYSAAAVLFLLLTGRPPFPAGTVQAVLTAHREHPAPPLDGARDGLADLIARCLSKDPTHRPPDGAALLAELDEHATRRLGAGWLTRASVTTLIPTALRATSSSTAAGAGTSTGGARETVVLTTAAASTGLAAAAVAAPQHAVSDPRPAEPRPNVSTPLRRLWRSSRPAAVLTAVVAFGLVAVAMTAVVAQVRSDESASPSAVASAGTASDPAASDPAASDPANAPAAPSGVTRDGLTIPIAAFCDKVDQAAVAALNGPTVDHVSAAPGDPPPGAGSAPVPPTTNFSCVYAAAPLLEESREGDILRRSSTPRLVSLSIRGRPATSRDFVAVKDSCGPDQVLPVEGLGQQADGRSCTNDESRGVNVTALLGQALFLCGIDRPAAEIDSALAARTVDFCVSTARALASR